MSEDNDHKLFECEVSEEILDPRIKENLELLNDFGDELNNASSELANAQNQLNRMVTKINVLLKEYYNRYKRSIERARHYLKSLLTLKIEADSCYVYVMDYDASFFALEQCRAICNRLEDEIVNTTKNNNMEPYMESLNQLNETNEKLDFWLNKIVEQESAKEQALTKLKQIYDHCSWEIKCFKLHKNDGILYFRQKLFFYKCIHKTMDYVNILQNIVSEANKKYNYMLAATKDLTIELKHNDNDNDIMGVDPVNPSPSVPSQNYKDTFCKDDRIIYQQSIEQIFSIILNMNSICNKNGLFISNNDLIQSDKNYLVNINNFISARNINSNTSTKVYLPQSQNVILTEKNSTKIYPISSFGESSQDSTSKQNKINAEFNELNLTDQDNHSNASSIRYTNSQIGINLGSLNESTTPSSFTQHNPIDHNSSTELDVNYIPNQDTFINKPNYISSNRRIVNYIPPCTSNNGNEVTSKLNRHSSFDCGQDSIISNSSFRNRNHIESTTMISSKINSPTHKKTKSDSNYKISTIVGNATTKTYIPTTSSVLVEENSGDLVLTIADVNSTTISMDLSAYNMDPSIINDIHVHIATSLAKFENNPNIPKIGNE